MIKKLKITSNLKIRIWGTFFYYKILINRKLDCLIDGKDTIRNFEVFLKDRLIMVYPNEDDRIYVYKFK